MYDPDPSNHNVLDYLSSLHLPMFPLPRGSKRPDSPGFFESATDHPSFDLTDHNVGVATGRGFIALDFDVKPAIGIDGTQSLDAWLAAGLLPEDTLTVRTPSGGIHLYLSLPDGHGPVANSVSALAPGVDVRGTRGYVVGPGSTTAAGDYHLLRASDRLAPCPQWLLDQLRAPRPRDPQTPMVELDTEFALARAARHLRTDAAPALAGAGGNLTTYKTAARLKDFGISEAACLDLMAEHYNPRCKPPWNPDELETLVSNAYGYGSAAPGASSPDADFSEPLSAAQLAAIEATRLAHQKPPNEDQPDHAPLARLSSILKPLAPFEPSTVLEPRRFVLQRLAARKYVTLLVAPGGAGKTTFGLLAALAVATGRPLLGAPFAPNNPPAHALYWTQEDDMNEIRLRLTALMRANAISWADLMDETTGTTRLHLFSGVERPFAAAVRSSDNRTILPSQDAADILAYIESHKIVSATFDPFVELHPADENDNGEIGRVARIFRKTAVAADCAVTVVHHTSKHDKATSDDVAGDMNKARGASALLGVARLVYTLYTIGEQAAKDYGIAPEDRHRYVRLDSAKSNLTLSGGNAALFRRDGVVLAEIGEEVGVLTPVEMTKRDRRESSATGQGRGEFASDVVLALGRLADRGIETPYMWVVVDELREPAGGHGDETEGALRKRISRLFDPDSGAPVCEELDAWLFAEQGGKSRFLRRG